MKTYGSYSNKKVILSTLEKKKHHQRNPGYEQQYLEEKVGEEGELPYGIASNWRRWDAEQASRLSAESLFDTIIELGPRSVGGRTRAIHIDPRNPDMILAGGISGGLWLSDTRGLFWEPLDDGAANLTVSSITHNPFNPDIVYYSTGEPRGGGGLGEGIFKSYGNGLQFAQLASSLDHPQFRYTWKIAHSLSDSNTVFVCTSQGLFRTIDAGQSWEEVLNVNSKDANDILVFDNGSVIVAIEETGLFYSSDGSAGSFTMLNTDVFPSTFSRIKLAYAENVQQFIYCMVAVDIGNDNAPMIFKSTDSGHNWVQKTTPITSGTQSRYNMMLGVHPDNPNRVVCGTVLSNYSENGGTSWFFTGSTHSDFHEFVTFPDNHNQFLVGNDGGVYLYKWNEIFNPLDRNNKYNVTQFYSGSHDPEDDITIGGTQDNGTIRVKTNQNSYVFGADGGYTHVHQQDDRTAYFSTQNDGLYRTDFWKQGVGIPVNIMQYQISSEGVSFINTYEMNYADGDQLYYKTHKGIWRSRNRGSVREKMNQDDIHQIYRLSLSYEKDPSLYFAGKNDVNSTSLYRSTDALTNNEFESVFSITGNPELSNRSTIQIDIHPNNNERILFSYYNYTSQLDQCWMIENTATTNVTVQNVTGNLPENLPVNVLKFHPYDPDNIFLAGTDFGLYYTLDAGQTWHKEAGLPNVQIFDLRIRPEDGKVFFYTFGRGIWMASLKLSESTSALPYSQDFESGNWLSSVTIEKQNNNGRIKVRSGSDGTSNLNLLVLDLSYESEILTSCRYIEKIEITELVEHQLIYDVNILEDHLNSNSGIFISYDNGSSYDRLQQLDTMEHLSWFRDTIVFTPELTGTILLKFEYSGRKEFPIGGLVFDNIGLDVREIVTPTAIEQDALSQVNIFPNPASDLLTITGLGSMRLKTIRLTSLNGSHIAEWKVQGQQSGQFTLPENISNGLYYLSFTSERGYLGSKAIAVKN
ncbi:MAG: hypothetical protein GY751_18590 [Bacteroidetes bacterium]|nr:hypothetical protein [Bacteroidota bacterium]